MTSAASKTFTQLYPLLILGVVLLLLAVFRSTVAAIGTALVILLATQVAMGAGFWLGLELSAVTATAPIIIIPVAVADSVHLIAAVARGLAGGFTEKEAVRKALQVHLKPITITSITTAWLL